MQAMGERAATEDWWGVVEVESGTGRCWELPGFRIIVFRRASEWLLASERSPEREIDCETWTTSLVTEEPSGHPDLVRFVAAPSANSAQLVPRAADRSVVAKPRIPLHLLPDEGARIYVSSPVWVEVNVGKPMHSLGQLPVRRLSDTWFGPNTREGEVAYALKTQARMQLEELPMRPHRLNTPIEIRNDGDEPLHIDRMNLPVPYLSVYATESGYLWSEEVTLLQGRSSELASLRVRKGAPAEAERARRLSGPRIAAESNFLVRAFSSIFDPMQREE